MFFERGDDFDTGRTRQLSEAQVVHAPVLLQLFQERIDEYGIGKRLKKIEGEASIHCGYFNGQAICFRGCPQPEITDILLGFLIVGLANIAHGGRGTLAASALIYPATPTCSRSLPLERKKAIDPLDGGCVHQHIFLLRLGKHHAPVSGGLLVQGPVAHLVFILQESAAVQTLVRQRRVERLSLIHAQLRYDPI